MLKKILATACLFFVMLANLVFAAPSFEANNSIAKDIGYTASFKDKVKSTNSLADNIKNLFFPSTSGNGGVLFDKIKLIGVGLAFVFIVRAGAMFLLYADDENELKKAKMNILYMFYGAFLVFGAAWLLGTVLGVGSATDATKTVLNTQNGILGSLLVFFRALAFYAAIVMMFYYGYQIMKSQEKEDKIKAARTGAINIIVALIAMKVLDYVYYIAQQSNFAQQGSNFIYGVGKVVGWILGIIIVVLILYSAALLITSRGNEEAWKKSKTIIRNVFLAVFVIFLFIVIVMDLVKNL